MILRQLFKKEKREGLDYCNSSKYRSIGNAFGNRSKNHWNHKLYTVLFLGIITFNSAQWHAIVKGIFCIYYQF